ncbi:MAG: CvpA family protein, partial [Actinobacteria bacterium]|nr:CvpA family protein [Actinomycetota bacterium]
MLDLLILAATVGLALVGLRRGFVISLFALVGFLIGAVLATQVAGAILPPRGRSLATPVFGFFAALLVGSFSALAMGSLGARLRDSGRLVLPGRTDGILGAAFSACIALGVAWMLGA